MTTDPFSPRPRGRQTIPLFRLAAIGAVVAAIGGAFVYVAGFVTPHRLTPQRIVNTFEANAGVHPGFRRNHAKGVCVSGYFEGNGQESRKRELGARNGRDRSIRDSALYVARTGR